MVHGIERFEIHSEYVINFPFCYLLFFVHFQKLKKENVWKETIIIIHLNQRISVFFPGKEMKHVMISIIMKSVIGMEVIVVEIMFDVIQMIVRNVNVWIQIGFKLGGSINMTVILDVMIHRKPA